MDLLPGNTIGGTREQVPFDDSRLSESIDKTGTAFARKVSISGELMPTEVASAKWVDADNNDFWHKAGHKLAATDIPPKIIETGLETLTIEPAKKRLKIAATEAAHWPVIDSSLIESTQVAKTALLQPYRPSHISPPAGTIAREVHGVQHSCRAAIWAVALLELRKQHGDPQARAFPDHMVPLLIKTCLFHDTGREGDGNDTPEWEQASADNLREHLRNFGVDQSLAWQCGEAICHKDNPKGCEHLPEVIQTLRSLLHDADTLDVMRVRGCFYMDRLECFAACQDDYLRLEWRLLAEEVCRVIARQGDLWYPIKLQDSDANCEHFFSIGDASLCENTKKQWEHHPSPFSYQLFSVGEQSGVVRELITPYTGQLTEPPVSSFSLAKLTPQVAAMEECQGSTLSAGFYTDPVSQQVYSIKPASCELSARNQLLMANLAGLLGIKVPQSFVHEEQGHFYVVSSVPKQWQGKLKGGEATLRSLSPEHWARLLLINVIVGNESMVNSAWEGIELTPEGEPVIFHWDYAGMATRYPSPEKPEPASKPDDFSSMPLLLQKLRNPQAPSMNSFPIYNPCIDILAQLEDDLLGHTLKDILRQVDWQALDRQIEHSGFLPGDRSWLRQTLHDRIAWLTTRFPNSLEAGERVSMAEYKAIEAAGIRGGWLPVKGRDIRGGQIGISQLLDANGQPITRMTLKLSREAGNKLADNLALERGLHRLASRVKYIHCRLNDDYRDWRSDLTSLAKDCDGLAEQLTGDKTRWHAKNQHTIDNTVTILQDIANNCRASLAADRPSIAKLPAIKTPLPAPVFPARVSSRIGEEVEAKVELAEFSHGFAKLTGQKVSYLSPEQLKFTHLSASPVRAVELESVVCEGGSIVFSPPNLPEALSFENQLTLTFEGHSKTVVEALFRELAGLGIDGERPDTSDLEEQWLDALADCHGCLGDMNLAVAADLYTPVNIGKKAFLRELLNFSDEQLTWEIHSRTRAGRWVQLRPGSPQGISATPARKFCPAHDIKFCADRQGNEEQFVINSLKNDATLSSFERRTQIGMEPTWHIHPVASLRRMKCDTGYAFTRIIEDDELADYSERIYEAGVVCMKLTSETLGRMDAEIYDDQCQFNGALGLDAFARNEKIIKQSTSDYQSLVQHNNPANPQETRFSNPLSLFDELNLLDISSPEDTRQLIYILKKRFSHWPDGRPLEKLFRQSWSVFYHEITRKGSQFDESIKSLVKACGEERIQLLFEQNPQLLKGKLDSLDGFNLDGRLNVLEGIDCSGCSMNDTVLQSFLFRKCKFNTELLNRAIVEGCFFTKCSFEGKRFSSSILDNVRFNPESGTDGQVSERTNQLSRILYQSCVNQHNAFNLEQWLKVMLKSSCLQWGSAPLDDLTRDILSQHMDEISRTYPEQLCKIISGLFFIDFQNAANAINFVRNNPGFYDHKIKDLKDFYFDFRTVFLKVGYSGVGKLGHPFDEFFRSDYGPGKDFSREALLALMLNVINLVLFPESNDQYIDFDVNANSADEHDGCLKAITESGSESTQSNTDGLPMVEMQRYKAFLCESHLKEYRNRIHRFWKECSEKSQLTIAKHCLRHQNVAVSPRTTKQFADLLSQDHDKQYWLEIYLANMGKHKKNEDEWNRLLSGHFREWDKNNRFY
ncbi:HD domain-containing protein [Endozoicomonas sp. 8E]|uniref:HD domain-containing protein n=1 Tax=Endozoicomonas sp. 8E TaxID=3035692 RepID=UPI002938E17D|nr:HD domain-containing protein [Endozoicomonas sp. 8E]WOG27687.1 HD domain-containing protein [Endozoicomonas sp. 8E]